MSISLVAQETTPSIRTKTKLVHDPNLCANAFALGRNLDPSLTSNQSGKPLDLLSSFTATCQQFGINPWIYLRDTLTKLPTTPAEQLNMLLPIK